MIDCRIILCNRLFSDREHKDNDPSYFTPPSSMISHIFSTTFQHAMAKMTADYSVTKNQTMMAQNQQGSFSKHSVVLLLKHNLTEQFALSVSCSQGLK